MYVLVPWNVNYIDQSDSELEDCPRDHKSHLLCPGSVPIHAELSA